MGENGPGSSDRYSQSWIHSSLHSSARYDLWSHAKRDANNIGNGYTNAGEFPTGSALALSRVTNLDGSTTNLIFDVHQYFDSDNSGTHSGCVSDKIQAAFAPLADYLRKHHRLALLSETGGGSNDQSCLTSKL